MTEQKRAFAPVVQEVIDDLMPIARKIAEGRGKYAISVAGSQGKGLSDGHSDVDFRLFHEKDLPWIDVNPDLWKDYFEAEARWKKKGIFIDGIWSRKIDLIDAALNKWLEGEANPDDIIWTIWGYHILPDIHHQAILEDPFNVISDWKKRLSVYPPKLKKVLLEKHLASVRYWRTDYHYQNKVKRGDLVFTAGISSKLVHNLIQILFALNHTYYVGDGQNLDFVKKFKAAPTDFTEKVMTILYPKPSDTIFLDQYNALASLIDEVVQLAVEEESRKI